MNLDKFIQRKDCLLTASLNKFLTVVTPCSKYVYAQFLYKYLKYNYSVFS